MKAILYGGSGFIGKNLAKFLSEAHGYQVVIVSRSRPNRAILGEKVSHVEWETFQDDLGEAVRTADLFFYLVNYSVPRQSYDDIDRHINIETNQLEMLFSHIRIVNPNLHFFYFSSGGAVYGEYVDKTFIESDARHPISVYGMIKCAGEDTVKHLSTKYLLKSTIVRPSNVYGRFQSHDGKQGVIGIFAYNISNQLPITIFGSGDGRKDYIYIDDFLKAVHGLIVTGSTGIFNIGSGYEASVNEIVGYLESKFEKKSRYLYKDLDVPDVNKLSLNCARIHETTGFNASYSVKLGIEEYVNWLKQEHNDN
jgi:UDP-glucose 4-epimerase